MSDPQITGWQAVETAPDDGEPVLVTWRCTGGWEITIARQVDVGEWMDAYSGERLARLEAPVYWQPRPTEPCP